MNVVSIGAVVWDVIGDKAYIGGAPFNVAVHLHRLGENVSILTRLGRDAWGEKTLEVLRKERISDRFVQWDDGLPTGTANVTFSSTGEPIYDLPLSSYDNLQVNLEMCEKIWAFHPDCLYFGTIEQRYEITREAMKLLLNHTQARYVFFDVNIRMNFEDESTLKRGLEKSNILKVNEDEYRLLSQMLFHSDLDMQCFSSEISQTFGLEIVIITLGAEGCAVFCDGKFHHVSCEPVACKDSIGAGDGFTAGFLHALAKGCSPVQAAICGNFLGGYVAEHHGAQPDYTLEFLMKMESLTQK
jgi:fructokinase